MMNKIFLIIAVIFVLNYMEVYSQEPLWKKASNYEKAGNYQEAIRLKKIMASEDKGTEWFIDDIAGIARCYSYTDETDSTLYYSQYLIELAEQLINKSDSIAEEYIQSAAWCFYTSNQYSLAVKAAERVLTLREKIYGSGSQKHLEWFDVLAFQAFKKRDLAGLMNFCKSEVEIIEQKCGIGSIQYESVISSIRGYAHNLLNAVPQFTTEWIHPFYTKIRKANILPQYQYEFEILQLEGFLKMEKLQAADTYAHKLEIWTYPSHVNKITLEDKVRIPLKLANYYRHIGNHIKSRNLLEEAWKCLSNANSEPSMAQMIDRHIVERQLWMDTLGRSRINAEWLIETATPIINAGSEDAETIAFFYESRAWAYEFLEDYDSAIVDIKKSIQLKPLYSRRKKLAQLYLHKKQYDLAEQQLLYIYKESDIPDVGRRSIESDLTMLYWLWDKPNHLEPLLVSDYENQKSEIRHAFAFMNENERETYLSKTLLGGEIKYDFYTGYSQNGKQWSVGNSYAYNMALIQKGLLLSTTKDINKILSNAPDSIQRKIKLYKEFKPDNSLPETHFERELRKEIMLYVSNHPIFLNQLNYTWRDVKNSLKEGEAAIEFINLFGFTPDDIDKTNPGIGALIITKDSQFPIFVKSAYNAMIDSIYKDDEYGNISSDEIYRGEAKFNMYNAIWRPLLPHLHGISTIYYAPTGVLQNINLDWIGEDESKFLAEKYILYRLSSTRELCISRPYKSLDKVILCGDITYSINVPVPNEKPISKLRSTTRSGFSPLKGTATEIDSICLEFMKYDYNTLTFKKISATEESTRELSGKSPKILHIATHGFYYSEETARKEYEHGGGFIAFQSLNPELYRSGLALTGAQDCWNIKDFDKYIKLDQTKDGILLSAEISHLDLSNTDLVVLSACETALGNVTSEGVYGLQRAFKLAGVNSIIMSLWKVDDVATQILMTAFYKNLLKGKSKRESLLEAQKRVRETSGFEEPYYWAAFILLDGLN